MSTAQAPDRLGPPVARRAQPAGKGSDAGVEAKVSSITLSRLKSWALYAVVGGLTFFLLLWLWIVEQFVVGAGGPNGATMGVDFSHTYSAVIALHRGLNPYDYHVLSRVQHEVLVPLHLPVEPRSPIVLVGTSPFFLWLLQPIAWLPYQLSAWIWIASTYLLSGAAFLVLLRSFGWRRLVLPTALFMAAPQTVLAAYYGNTIDLVFIGMACAVPLLNRRPLIAGICLSLATLKAPAIMPLALLLILFHASAKKRVLIGLLASFVGRNLWAAILSGQGSVIDRWTDGLFTFSKTMERQPNLIGLSGIYSGKVDHGERMVVEILLVAAASVVTLVWYRRWRSVPSVPFLASAWLWPLWLLATPYAHFIDELVLVIPLLALLGRDAVNFARPISLTVVTVLIGSILLYSTSVGGASVLSLPLAAVMLCFLTAAPSSADTSSWARYFGRESMGSPFERSREGAWTGHLGTDPARPRPASISS